MSLNVLTQGGGTGGESASIFITGLSETDSVKAVKDGKTVNGKWVSEPNPAWRNLPEGYTQVEYLESSGTQYIDTGVSANGTELTVECDGTALGDGYTLFGSNVNTSTSGFEVLPAPDRGYVRFNYHDADIDVSEVPYDGMFRIDRNKCYINDSLVYTFAPVSFNVSNIWLFGRNNNGVLDNSGTATIRSCRVWVSDVLMRHLIPVKRNSDGVLGMYDLVNGVFYTNAGTGTFIAGEEIPSIVQHHLIKIKEYGMWTVTTTNGVQTETQDVLVDAAVKYEIEMRYRLWLYRDGDECTDVTGGWSQGTSTNNTGTFTKNANNITVYVSGLNATRGAATNNPVDVTGYSRIVMLCDITQTGGSTWSRWGLTTARTWVRNEHPSGTHTAEGLYGATTQTNALLEGNIEGLTGSYYPFVEASCGSDTTFTVVIKQMWLI